MWENTKMGRDCFLEDIKTSPHRPRPFNQLLFPTTTTSSSSVTATTSSSTALAPPTLTPTLLTNPLSTKLFMESKKGKFLEPFLDDMDSATSIPSPSSSSSFTPTSSQNAVYIPKKDHAGSIGYKMMNPISSKGTCSQQPLLFPDKKKGKEFVHVDEDGSSGNKTSKKVKSLQELGEYIFPRALFLPLVLPFPCPPGKKKKRTPTEISIIQILNF
eukprot:TRINITY_DN5785_c0_g1_i2.p1 TRINITY_DN5785_c0_g1~~TRINITY_DN5785_c0_g1_i2.p1  ORF type:complete len:215 (-),score=59.79 TRINITY_DN5785_c0_g1_i2:50-694(-)